MEAIRRTIHHRVSRRIRDATGISTMNSLLQGHVDTASALPEISQCHGSCLFGLAGMSRDIFDSSHSNFSLALGILLGATVRTHVSDLRTPTVTALLACRHHGTAELSRTVRYAHRKHGLLLRRRGAFHLASRKHQSSATVSHVNDSPVHRYHSSSVHFSLVQTRLSQSIKTENQLLLAFQLIGPFLQRIQAESTKLLLEVNKPPPARPEFHLPIHSSSSSRTISSLVSTRTSSRSSTSIPSPTFSTTSNTSSSAMPYAIASKPW